MVLALSLPTSMLTGVLGSTLLLTSTVMLTPPPSITVVPTQSITPGATATSTVTATTTATPSPPPTADVTPTPIPTATPTPAVPGPLYLPLIVQRASVFGSWPRVWGMQFMLDELPERHLQNVNVELPRARQLGLSSVRTNLRWDRVEPENTTPEEFDWRELDQRLGLYSSRGFDVIVTIVAYPNWATRYQCGYELLPGMEAEWREFVHAAAARYSRSPQSSVIAWKSGNEPDGKTVINDEDWERPPEWGRGEPTVPYGGCWGDRAPEYGEFLRMAYEEIKAVDPDVLVTHGGLAYADLRNMFHMDFLDKLLEAGGGDYFDFLNYHWFPNVPYQVSGPEKHRSLTDTLARHGVRKDVWLTETYRLTFPQDPVGSQRWQIRFLTTELVEMLAFGDLTRVYWYGWVDFPPGYKDPDLPQRGLVRHDHTPKTALPILPYVVSHTNGQPVDISTRDVVAVRFVSPGGRRDHAIAWSRDGSPSVLTLPAGQGERAWARVHEFPEEMLLAGRCCAEYIVHPKDGVFRFEVGPDSLFIELPAR